MMLSMQQPSSPPSGYVHHNLNDMVEYIHHDQDTIQAQKEERVLSKIRRNEDVRVCGVFLQYEDFGLPGYSCSAGVERQTQRLVEALKGNTKLTELTLNLRALEFVDDLTPLLDFLNNNPSLTSLHIRVPPCTRAGSHALGLFGRRLVCKRLKELTFWIPRERPQRLRMHVAVPLRPNDPNMRRRRRPVRFRQSYAETSCHFNLAGLGRFVAEQPHLDYLRIQASSLTTSQWTLITNGLAASQSLKHVELRRVEIDCNNAQMAKLAPHMVRLDLHGTVLDVSAALEKVRGAGSLNRLSWSSASLVHVRRLTSVLSLPSATLRHLELSHLNLSGDKCLLIAQMMQNNTSIQNLNMSRAQLKPQDAGRLAKGLRCNQTLLSLTLMDNQMWKGLNSVVAFQEFKALLQQDTPLQHLDLSDNGLDTADFDNRYSILLQGLIHNTHLRTLKLSNQSNLFLDTLQTIFGGSPRRLHADVSKTLGTVLSQNHLTELYLNYNRLDDAPVAEFLTPALAKNSSLKVLSLKRVGLGNESMVALSHALANHRSLQLLDVSFNINVTESGYEVLSKAIRTMPNLHTLWFHTTARHREEEALAQHRYTIIISNALVESTSLKYMSHSEILDDQSDFYLRLNRHGRKQLCQEHRTSETGDMIPVSTPDSLWPRLMEAMPLDILALYVRRNGSLLASVSQQPPVAPTAPATSPVPANTKPHGHVAAEPCTGGRPTRPIFSKAKISPCSTGGISRQDYYVHSPPSHRRNVNSRSRKRARVGH